MQKSLFKKYLLLSSAIIMVGFLIMGTVLFVSVSNYWIDDKLDLLSSNIETVSKMVESRVEKVEGSGSDGKDYVRYVPSSDVEGLISMLAPNVQSDIFITQVDGTVFICSDNSGECRHLSHQVPQNIMKAAIEGKYTGLDNLGGMYKTQQYVVGVPITYYDEITSESQVIGAAFIASTAQNFTDFKKDIIQICIMAAVFAALISFVSSGIMTYRMVLPLREMSIAASNFGKGDFSRRIRVRGDDEVGELAIALNNMASSLSASESMSRSFVANVSHELKTPMTTIAGFIDGILDGTIPPEKQKQYLKIVSTEVKRLSRLVRSMLDLSRIDSGEMKLHRIRFEIKETIINSLLSFENAIENKNVEICGLEEMENVFVDGDPDLLFQVIYNLFDNAVKFVDEGGKIYAHLVQTSKDVHVIIGNSGPGIAPDELPLIFDRFYKTDKSRSRDKNGMGLGLYIVRTIIQLHGGEITVRSVENQYTEFEFSIPVIAAESSPKARKDGKHND